MMLCTRVSHVLPIYLYDTTGEADVLVNDLLHMKAGNCRVREKGEGVGFGIDIHWLR